MNDGKRVHRQYLAEKRLQLRKNTYKSNFLRKNDYEVLTKTHVPKDGVKIA